MSADARLSRASGEIDVARGAVIHPDGQGRCEHGLGLAQGAGVAVGHRRGRGLGRSKVRAQGQRGGVGVTAPGGDGITEGRAALSRQLVVAPADQVAELGVPDAMLGQDLDGLALRPLRLESRGQLLDLTEHRDDLLQLGPELGDLRLRVLLRSTELQEAVVGNARDLLRRGLGLGGGRAGRGRVVGAHGALLQ